MFIACQLMNAEFLHLETLSSKLCGFNFSNCIVRDSCCPPNMRACKIVFQLCFVILKKFLTFKSIVALFIDNKKKLFMSLLLTFTAALTEVYWPTNITPSWGKSKICVAHWKDRPWKEKVHVQLKTIGQCTVGDDVQPGQMVISGQKPSWAHVLVAHAPPHTAK